MNQIGFIIELLEFILKDKVIWIKKSQNWQKR